ncbi:RNA-directed DNA polymerase, eukaryota, reverse transcriptase zinc-binding domain protein, partial [Tanacetum coccineum]
VLYCSFVVTIDTRHNTAGDRKYWRFTDVRKCLKRYGGKEHFILPRGRISTAGYEVSTASFILSTAYEYLVSAAAYVITTVGLKPSLEARIFASIEDVVTKKIVYHLFDGEVELFSPDGGFGTYIGGAIGGVWADILKAVKHIEDIDISFNVSFSLIIGNGSNTSFWKDHWCGDGSRLMDLFPRLYALESSKDCKINDRWHCLDGIWSGNWSWHCPLRGRALDELANLVSRIGNLSLDSTRVDRWSWAGETSGIFKVKTLSKKIQTLSLNNFSLGKHHYWNSWIPRKVNICVWRASLDRLPSRANLAIRGIDLSSTSCPFCEIELEDIEHSLI